MQTLFLNNYHYLRGGSERIYFGEMELLEKHGHDVCAFSRAHARNTSAPFADYFPNDIQTATLAPSWSAFRTIGEIIWSREAKRALESLLSTQQFDMAHAHNIYGRLTSSVLDLLHEKHIPVVMTLHDYKLICPSYKLMSHGHVCEDCQGRRFYRAILNRCHKDSFVASAIYALESYYNEWAGGKYAENVSLFIAPSLFLRDKLIEFGWSQTQIVHVPNFLPFTDMIPNYSPGNYFVFLGRLSSEKGISTLVDAFIGLSSTSVKLRIMGEGPLRQNLEERAAGQSSIEFTGYLTGDALKEATKKALAVIIPSEWYENAPISILEAFAYGKPVIGSNIGGIPEMIDDGVTGYVFEPGSVDDLTSKMEIVLSLPENRIQKMGKAARAKVEAEYSPESHYHSLINIYESLLHS